MAKGPTFILRSDASRDFACSVILRAPAGSVVEVSPPRRTLDQNAKLHAMITDVMKAKPEGRSYPLPVWKGMFMASAGHKVRFEPALDGNGIVPLGFQTSRLSKAECAELIECVGAYAAEHGIELHD